MAKKILIVEDEKEMQDMLKLRLSHEEYTVITADQGQHGLDAARLEKPDLILLDIMLPKLDGFHVCRMLKFDPKLSHIRVILLTAKGRVEDREMAAKVRADAFLTKPIEPEKLLQTIHILLRDD